MSGHSKWNNIKQRKGKSDAARSNVFTKIGKLITVAVKSGGPDPNTNSKLRDVIAKAKQSNMPNDNIQRSIKKASGEGASVNYEELTYEGYGAGGVAIIVNTLTDNKNRTGGDVRHLFDKYGGSLGAPGCVSYMFQKKGLILVDLAEKDEEEMFELALEAGAEDVVTESEVYEIYTAPQDLGTVRESLEASGVSILSADVDMIPDNYIAVPDKNADSFEKLIDALEENDDVQNVYHNAE